MKWKLWRYSLGLKLGMKEWWDLIESELMAFSA